MNNSNLNKNVIVIFNTTKNLCGLRNVIKGFLFNVNPCVISSIHKHKMEKKMIIYQKFVLVFSIFPF